MLPFRIAVRRPFRTIPYVSHYIPQPLNLPYSEIMIHTVYQHSWKLHVNASLHMRRAISVTRNDLYKRTWFGSAHNVLRSFSNRIDPLSSVLLLGALFPVPYKHTHAIATVHDSQSCADLCLITSIYHHHHHHQYTGAIHVIIMA